MSSQPPWETQIQPGWGSQPQPPEQPRQQPQQPQQGGGWNQGPYSPPQQPPQGPPPQFTPPQPGPPPQQFAPPQPGPPQQFAPPQPGPQQQAPYPQQQPQYVQQPPPPQFTPPQLPGMPSPMQEPPPKNNTGRILLIVASVVVLALVAGGIYLFTKNGKSDSKASTSPTTGVTTSATTTEATTGATTPAQASTSASFPNNSYTGTAAPPASASSTPGASLDDAKTDKTPFTPDAMVAKSFVDDKKVTYALKFAQSMPCDKVGDKTVQDIVKAAKCTNMMAASWIDPANNRIVVSAMIIPFQDAATAAAVDKKLGSTHTGDYAQWCPPAGQPGATTCTKLAKAGNASREGKFGNFHRYVLITTAVYADLRNDNSQKDWLTAAAHGAFQNTLPGQ